MITDTLATGDRLPACRSFGPIHHLFTKLSFSEADKPDVNGATKSAADN